MWVAVFTFIAAFANSFSQLFGIRFLQGLGYGGEAAVGGVLISEVVRPALRGRVAASVQSGYAVGYAISVALLPVIASLFPEQIGWRVFFAIGIVPASWCSSSAASSPSPAARAPGGSRQRGYRDALLGYFHPRSPAAHLARSDHGDRHLRRCVRHDYLAADLSAHGA